LKIWVVLSDRGLNKGEIFVGSPKIMHEDTHLVFLQNSKGFGVDMPKHDKIHYSRALLDKTRQNPLLWGYMKNSEEKGLQITNL
jgi:hypothetical protein